MGTQLLDGAPLLRLALMAAEQNPCKKPILELVDEFHTSNGQTKIGTQKMVFIALRAVTFHQMALEDFDNSMFEDGMEVFRKTAPLAEEMVLASKKLEDDATKLQTKASECLLAAETDKSKHVELKQKIEEEKKALLLSKEQTKQNAIALEKKSEHSKKEAEEIT